MSLVKSKNTKPEIKVRSYLHQRGFRYKLHVKTLPGKPDIVLPKYKTIIFVHGCFWHGHENCKSARMPKSNADYWAGKIKCNKLRDKKAFLELSSLGWNVLNIWECELKDFEKLVSLEQKILANANTAS